MKNKKILVLVILLISFFLTGCDNYKDGNYGEQIVNSWFNYSYGDIDLGKTRRNLEKIKEIETIPLSSSRISSLSSSSSSSASRHSKGTS